MTLPWPNWSTEEWQEKLDALKKREPAEETDDDDEEITLEIIEVILDSL